jgi:Pyridoxal-dependent decarboxylase conserved domain
MRVRVSGGTVSNLYAVLAARYQKFPRVKIEGLQSLPGPLVMFTSAHVSTSFNHSNESQSIVLETLCISSFESKTVG